MDSITIKGSQWPCRLTMGALLRFKRATGKDVGQLDNLSDMEDMLTLMWCCVASACKADGVEFSMDLETFCDSMTIAEVNQWNQQVGTAAEAQPVAADDKKKVSQPT